MFVYVYIRKILQYFLQVEYNTRELLTMYVIIGALNNGEHTSSCSGDYCDCNLLFLVNEGEEKLAMTNQLASVCNLLGPELKVFIITN